MKSSVGNRQEDLGRQGEDVAIAWLWSILTAGDPSPEVGGVAVSQHAALPPRGRARFLVPITGARAPTVASVVAYNRLRRWHVRAARAGLAAGIGLKIGSPLLRRRVVSTAPKDGSSELGERWLLEHLRQVLGEAALVFAVGLKPGDPFSKPVLQLFRPDGTPVGYAKVGWNAVTIPMVRNEADVLTGWPRGSEVAVPKLLHAGEWAGRYVAVTAPMPPSVRRLRRIDGSPVRWAPHVYRSGPVVSATLTASAYWARLVSEANRLAESGIRSGRTMHRLVEHVGERHGELAMRFGRWHGDWVNWNLAIYQGRLWAWDWEYSALGVPLGFDVVHHVFQREFVARRRPVSVALSAAAAVAAEHLPASGVPRVAIDATTALHRLELLLRHSHAEALGASPDPRLDLAAVGAAT